MRIAFLAGRDTASTRLSVESVCKLAGVLPVALLLDSETPSYSKRFKNLRRNLRREGLGYLPHRVVEGLHEVAERLARRVVPGDVDDLLQRAFPDRSWSLDDLGRRYGFPIVRVNNLNSKTAATLLKEKDVDLGIVLGTRILKRSTFSVPRLGSINLHKGRVPEYRGMPPGFWELYDGETVAGVTVHFVDDGLDTGDVIGADTVPILEADTEESLRTKLDREGARLLALCVESLRDGNAVPIPQTGLSGKPRTNPTRRQRNELRRRSPDRLVDPYPKWHLLKTAVYLGLYYSGVYHGVRWVRRRSGSSRAVIMLYHRVDDTSVDSLTASTTAFAEHVAVLKRRYQVISTSTLLDRLERGDPFDSNVVLVHFDDCYRGVWTHAAPILREAGLPATAFVASGFVGTDRRFEHDRVRSPFLHENLSADELRSLAAAGIEIGAHTVNHVNLGSIPKDEVIREVLGSRADLERILGSPVLLFSFPFGRLSNISEEARDVIEKAGFRALFSAYGGVINRRGNRFDLPRRGASTEHRPLDIMMEIEGLSIADWIPSRIRSRL